MDLKYDYRKDLLGIKATADQVNKDLSTGNNTDAIGNLTHILVIVESIRDDIYQKALDKIQKVLAGVTL